MSYASLGISALDVRKQTVEGADPAVVATAQAFVDQGNEAFRAGDYVTALHRYTDAWSLLPAPNMLIIIGLAMLRLGRFQDASYRFQRYLRENPQGERRGQAQDLLAEAQVGMERGGAVDMTISPAEAQAAAAHPAPAPTPPAEVPADVLAAKRASIQSGQQVQQSAPPPTSIRNPYAPNYVAYLAWGGVALAAVGVTLVGVHYWKRSRSPKPVAANRRRRRRSSRRR